MAALMQAATAGHRGDVETRRGTQIQTQDNNTVHAAAGGGGGDGRIIVLYELCKLMLRRDDTHSIFCKCP